MARNNPWRRTINDLVSWRQDQALSSTLYIVREVGPTGFHLKEENQVKVIKAYLGDPHRCNCTEFLKDKDICKHICWLLLKKFRIPRQNPVSWQLGLVEREINEVLRGLTNQADAKKSNVKTSASATVDGRTGIEQREITAEDVCPICQDGLLEKKLPVTFCKYGCGNSTHIKCMKIWADHQKSQGEKTIKCPFCREDFGPFDSLKQEERNAKTQGGRSSTATLSRHFGVTCRGCYVNDVNGKCYRCECCIDYHLCQACFNTPIHREHAFQFRQKRNQRWRPAQRPSGWLLPQAVTDDLMQRDITENDYDLLMQLERQQERELSNIPEHVVEALPQETVRVSSQLLAPGVQCRMCLQAYHQEQIVRRLPCRHKFHRRCVDPWLIHSQPSCPVCGVVVWSEHTHPQQSHTTQNCDTKRVKPPSLPSVATAPTFALEISGIGRLAQGHDSTRPPDAHGDDTVYYNELSTSGESEITGESGADRARANSFSDLHVRSENRPRDPHLLRRRLPRQRGSIVRHTPPTRIHPPSAPPIRVTHIMPPLIGVNPATVTGLDLVPYADGRAISAESHQPMRRLGQTRSLLPGNHTSSHTTHASNKLRVLEDLFLGNNPRLNARETGALEVDKTRNGRLRTGQINRFGGRVDAKYETVGQLALDGVNIGP